MEGTAGEKSENLGISEPNPEGASGGILFYYWSETITEIASHIFQSRGPFGVDLVKVKMVTVGERKGPGNNAMGMGVRKSGSGNREQASQVALVHSKKLFTP